METTPNQVDCDGNDTTPGDNLILIDQEPEKTTIVPPTSTLSEQRPLTDHVISIDVDTQKTTVSSIDIENKPSSNGSRRTRELPVLVAENPSVHNVLRHTVSIDPVPGERKILPSAINPTASKSPSLVNRTDIIDTEAEKTPSNLSSTSVNASKPCPNVYYSPFSDPEPEIIVALPSTDVNANKPFPHVSRTIPRDPEPEKETTMNFLSAKCSSKESAVIDATKIRENESLLEPPQGLTIAALERLVAHHKQIDISKVATFFASDDLKRSKKEMWHSLPEEIRLAVVKDQLAVVKDKLAVVKDKLAVLKNTELVETTELRSTSADTSKPPSNLNNNSGINDPSKEQKNLNSVSKSATELLSTSANSSQPPSNVNHSSGINEPSKLQKNFNSVSKSVSDAQIMSIAEWVNEYRPYINAEDLIISKSGYSLHSKSKALLAKALAGVSTIIQYETSIGKDLKKVKDVLQLCLLPQTIDHCKILVDTKQVIDDLINCATIALKQQGKIELSKQGEMTQQEKHIYSVLDLFLSVVEKFTPHITKAFFEPGHHFYSLSTFIASDITKNEFKSMEMDKLRKRAKVLLKSWKKVFRGEEKRASAPNDTAVAKAPDTAATGAVAATGAAAATAAVAAAAAAPVQKGRPSSDVTVNNGTSKLKSTIATYKKGHKSTNKKDVQSTEQKSIIDMAKELKRKRERSEDDNKETDKRVKSEEEATNTKVNSKFDRLKGDASNSVAVDGEKKIMIEEKSSAKISNGSSAEIDHCDSSAKIVDSLPHKNVNGDPLTNQKSAKDSTQKPENFLDGGGGGGGGEAKDSIQGSGTSLMESNKTGSGMIQQAAKTEEEIEKERAEKKRSEEDDKERRMKFLAQMFAATPDKSTTYDHRKTASGNFGKGDKETKKKKKRVQFSHDNDLEKVKYFLRNDSDSTKLFDSLEGVDRRYDEVIRDRTDGEHIAVPYPDVENSAFTDTVDTIDSGCQIPWREPEAVYFSMQEQELIRRINFHKVSNYVHDKYRRANVESFYAHSDGASSGPSEDRNGDDTNYTNESSDRKRKVEEVQPPIIIPLDMISMDYQQLQQQELQASEANTEVEMADDYDYEYGEIPLEGMPRKPVNWRNVKYPFTKCTFFLKGKCHRGSQCHYSHE